MGDLSKADCDLCFAQCKTQILKCLPFQKATRGGRNFFDGCYLRYDDFDFFQDALSPEDRAVCGVRDFHGNRTAFASNVVGLMRNLSFEAQKNDGFSVGFVDKGNSTAYGLVQCWKSINASSCERCLENAVEKVGSCLPKEEGRVLNAGCYLRYSIQKFYNNSATDSSGGGQGELGLQDFKVFFSFLCVYVFFFFFFFSVIFMKFFIKSWCFFLFLLCFLRVLVLVGDALE